MLAALERGVKGGTWFSLMDKVYAAGNLRAAAQTVVANKGSAGVDRVTVEMFEEDLDANVERLQEELRRGSYEPQAIRRTYIPKAGSKELRPLGIPTVRDRVVSTSWATTSSAPAGTNCGDGLARRAWRVSGKPCASTRDAATATASSTSSRS
jgi:hypothetical protein